MTPQTRMRVLHVVAETPLSFLQHLKDITYIERRPLRYVDPLARRHLSPSCSYNILTFSRTGFAQSDCNLWFELSNLTDWMNTRHYKKSQTSQHLSRRTKKVLSVQSLLLAIA